MSAPEQLMLDGDHVRLEPLRSTHIPALVAAVGENPAAYRFSTVPQGEPAMRAWVLQALAGRDAGDAVAFSIYSHDLERIVGSTRFYELQWWRPADGERDPAPDACMIGYTWLSASAQRTGANTQTKLLMLSHAFEVWNVDRVGFRIDARNERSRASVQRLGASFEGVRRAERLGADGVLRDSAYYSILASEWPASKALLTDRWRRCAKRQAHPEVGQPDAADHRRPRHPPRLWLVLETILAAVFAALLVAASTLAARRWGLRVGGVVSAFPAIVGPVLVLVALEHGPVAAARNADGTLLGLVGLAAFTAAYGRAAARRSWTASLLNGWAAAAVAGLGSAAVGARAGAPVGLLMASVSLWLAHRSLVTASVSPPLISTAGSSPQTSIPARMTVTALIVVALAGAVSALGPLAGGILAALPVLASVLTVLAHREGGAEAAVALLRGTVAGMAGFVAFCQIVALLITRAPLVPAFAVATVAALLAQMPALRIRRA